MADGIAQSPEAEKLYRMRHSLAHVLAQAVLEIRPGATLGFGPAIDDGFYYDFILPEALGEDDFPAIEKLMKRIIKQGQAFECEDLSREAAMARLDEMGEPYKREYAEALFDERGIEQLTFYRNGPFVDMCEGPHVANTRHLPKGAFKLRSVAGAYWRGDSDNVMMTRIYAWAFSNKIELEAHVKAHNEALKRDHRRLGKDLDLFSFQPEGPGFPFWHPNGMVLQNEVLAFWREAHQADGYVEVKTPIMLSDALWHKSGHYENYKENMYFTNIDEQGFAVKPMNCPGGVLIYKDRRRSYRELPMRVAELGLVHRHELSGVLHGLFRVRSFTQDDAHIYCEPAQICDEVVRAIHLLQKIYGTFGFDDIAVELSTRPPKSIGTDQMWNNAEEQLRNALDNVDLPYELNEGDGAFYGPKIDFHIRDCMKRSWQCGTIQLDFALPERFDCTYQGADGAAHRPVMLHRALLGSIERFIGILIEHHGGAFPTWLAPVQVRAISVSDKYNAYAEKVIADLQAQGVRAELDQSTETMGKKIRNAVTGKIPNILIVGEREEETGTVTWRRYGVREQETMSLDAFCGQMVAAIRERVDPR